SSSSAPPLAVRQPVSSAPAAPQKAVLPTCAQCGRQHGGSVCWKTSGRCFSCGGVGHLSRDCPRRQAQAGAGQGGRPAKVFAVTSEQAQVAEYVTEGTVLVHGFHARVLFDSGATDSFISAFFTGLLCNQCGVAISLLGSPLSVASPGGFLSVTHV